MFLALENSRDIVKWMFDANIGDVSNTIYTCGNNYVVVSLSGINKVGDKDLEIGKRTNHSEYSIR